MSDINLVQYILGGLLTVLVTGGSFWAKAVHSKLSMIEEHIGNMRVGDAVVAEKFHNLERRLSVVEASADFQFRGAHDSGNRN